jgi:hypothetical protein
LLHYLLYAGQQSAFTKPILFKAFWGRRKMPSKSKAQRNLMAAAAHNPAFAKKVGVPTSVAKEFNQADKGKKFREGGDMKESKAMVKKEIGFMKKAGAPASMIKHEKAEAKGMKKGGMAECKTVAKKEVKSHEKRMHGMAKGGGIEVRGKTKGTMVKMKRGGSC